MLFINYLRKQLKEEELIGYEKFVIEDLIINIENHGTEDNNFIESLLTYGVSSGCVSSLIYYHQTRLIFASYFEDIMDIVNTTIDYNKDIHFNDMVWFTYELIASMYFNDYSYMIEEGLKF